MKFDFKKFNIEYRANLTSFKKLNVIKIWAARPLNETSQKITDFKISFNKKMEYKDTKENKILYFQFRDQKNINFNFSFSVTINKRSEILIKKDYFSQINIPSEIKKKFTKDEKYLEQTADLKKKVLKILDEKENIFEKIIAFQNFLKNNFKYSYPVKNRGVKNLKLKNLKGDCGEVGALFVTMCRIAKIPAINNTGFVIYHDELNNIYEHGWTSIYINKLGWVEIDPLAENIKKNNNQYIYEQNNYLLTVTKGFNIPLKPVIPKNHKLDYWNKLGLPLTYNSAQVLQPLIFSSLEKVKFKDSIKIIL